MKPVANPLAPTETKEASDFVTSWFLLIGGIGLAWFVFINDYGWEWFVLASVLMVVPSVRFYRRAQRLQNALKHTKFNMRQMLDATEDLIFLHHRDGKIITVNLSAARKLGYSRAELQQMTVWDIDEDCVVKNDPVIQNRLSHGHVVKYCTEFVCRDGTRFPADVVTRPAEWLSDDLLVSIVRDVTPWREAERQLEFSRKELERARNRLETRVTQKSRELVREKSAKQLVEQEADLLRQLLQTIIDTMPSALMAVDCERRITLWNRAAEQLTGIRKKQALKHHLEALAPFFDRQLRQYIELRKEGVTPTSNRFSADFNGNKHLLEVLIYELEAEAVQGWVIRADDVTEKAAIEEMLVQSEKMLSLGGLAAGMAHEINNPLGAILQSVQTLHRRLTPDFHRFVRVAESLSISPASLDAWIDTMGIRRSLAIIEEASARAADIVSDMLSFARPDVGENERLVLQELIEESIRLAQREYNARKKFDFLKVQIHREYRDAPIEVSGKRTRLQQVFLNLLTNAAEAMHLAKTETPTIWIYLRLEHNWVNIEFVDNGPGMPEQVRRRVFEPFYTTKRNWKGTGLGLSVSYFIVTEQMGGTMFVESEPGVGTRFIVRLPLADQVPDYSPMDADGPAQFELPLDMKAPLQPMDSELPKQIQGDQAKNH